MSETRTGTPSVVERTRPVDIGAPVVGAHVLGRTAVFVAGGGSVLIVLPDGEPRRVAVHAGGILASSAAARRVLTAGDDGKVVAIDATGETRTVMTDPKHRWVDRVAAGPDGAVAWSMAKTIGAQNRKGV